MPTMEGDLEEAMTIITKVEMTNTITEVEAAEVKDLEETKATITVSPGAAGGLGTIIMTEEILSAANLVEESKTMTIMIEETVTEGNTAEETMQRGTTTVETGKNAIAEKIPIANRTIRPSEASTAVRTIPAESKAPTPAISKPTST